VKGVKRGGTALLSDGELLARLVEFDTVSQQPNEPAVDWIAHYLDRPGLRLTRQEGPEPGKVNLVALAGPEEADPARTDGPDGLTLCGHLDVVPAREADWTSDPFRLVRRGDRYVARGAADMKGFCALAVNRMAAFPERGLPGRLALLLTFDEEVGSLGAHHFVQHWPEDGPLPRSVVVGEPTSLRAVRMHKGHLGLRITLRGRAAHTGSPHLGVNAVEPAAPVLAALAELRQELESERSEHAEHFASVPHPVLAVSGIRGGEAMNIVPERCEIDVGLRLMPGMDTGAAVERVRAAVSAAAPGASSRVEELGNNPPLLTAEDAPLHRTLGEVIGQTVSIGASYASDAGWLSTAGYECVLFGPGSIEVAHKPDEYLPIAEFEEAGRHLDELIPRMCGAEANDA
jgi:acetylornithine deacetylase